MLQVLMRMFKSPSRAVMAAMIGAAAVTAQFVSGKAVRDALFLTSLDITALPTMLLATSACSILLVVANARASRRVQPATWVPALFVVSGVLFLAEWLLRSYAPLSVAVARDRKRRAAGFADSVAARPADLVPDRPDAVQRARTRRGRRRGIARIGDGGTLRDRGRGLRRCSGRIGRGGSKDACGGGDEGGTHGGSCTPNSVRQTSICLPNRGNCDLNRALPPHLARHRSAGGVC